MSQIDIDHLRIWIGKTHVDEDVISARHARLTAAIDGDRVALSATLSNGVRSIEAEALQAI